MSDAPPILSVHDLSVQFGHGEEAVLAADKVSFVLRRGKMHALVGESGSGKSVCALSILKLLAPWAHHPTGEIRFDNQDMLRLTSQKLTQIRGDRISMIFQEPMTSLNPLHRVGKQISEAMRAHQPVREAQATQKMLEILGQVGIDNPERLAKAYPHQLSGGQRQRIMIAMALINDPDILIADEPTTALDVTIQKQIVQLLKKQQAQRQLSILFITHDLGLVRSFADDVSVMKKGKIVEQGPVADIMAKPQHHDTKKLIFARPQRMLMPIQADAQTLIKGRNIKVWFPQKSGFLRRAKSYIRAVDFIDVTVKKGETLGIVGESGSGKTTLGLALARLIPSQGDISFMGENITGQSLTQMRPLRKKIQMVFQDPFGSLSPRLTVHQIVAEGLEIHQPLLSADQIAQKVDQMLEQVGLKPEWARRYPHEFSGGQRQRIAIARAMILQPDLVIMDEPTSALDRTIQMQIVNILLQLQQHRQISYIFISHDLSIVQLLAHRVMVVKKGKVVEQGLTEQIFENPQHDYTKQLMDAALA